MKVTNSKRLKYILSILFLSIVLFVVASVLSRQKEIYTLYENDNSGGVVFVLKAAGFPFNFISNENNDLSFYIIWHAFLIDYVFWTVVAWIIINKSKLNKK